MQSQTTQSWYIGLWSRVADLDPLQVSALLEQRSLVRIAAMRSTIHLLTAEDAVALRPVLQPAVERAPMGAFGKHLVGLDRAALCAAAREVLASETPAASELGRSLSARFPGRDPAALAQAARAWLPLVQIPPRGLWGRSGQPRQALLDTWVGRTSSPATVEDLVVRYLGAFGPATVRDIQTWSGLTRLASVVEGLGDRLVRFAEFVDLPDAPRPDPDVPAPVRFLYDFDNLLLSHADRSRVLGDPGDADYAAHGYTADSNRQPSTVLVAGFAAGTWTATKGALTIRGFRRFTTAERDELVAEGTALHAFLYPDAEPDVRLT